METKTLYYIVFIITLLFAFMAQGRTVQVRDGSIKRNFYPIPFLISLIVPWYMLAFTDIGIDYKNYYNIIREVDLYNYNKIFSVESGFALVSAILKIIFNYNIDVVIFIFKSFSIVLSFVAIYNLRHQLSIWISVFAYMLLLFLPSFYLISQTMASAIVLFSLSLYLCKKKVIIPLLLLILGGFIHNSIFIFIPVAITGYYLTITKYTKTKIVFIIILSLVIVASSTSIYGYVMTYVPGFHYINYGDNYFEGSGLFFLVKYPPLFYIAYIVWKYGYEKDIKIFIFVFIVASAVFNILSYRFIVIERMEFLLLANYILFLPIFMDNQVYLKNNHKKYSNIKIIYFIYIVFIGYNVIQGRTSANVDMAVYHYFNPFLTT